jgi:hypothetical protein
MQKLGLYMGETGHITFTGIDEAPRVITVRESRVQANIGASLGPLAAGTLVGRLMLGGEQVYGRFTEGYMKVSGERFPVCLQIVNVDPITRRFVSGTPIEPDSTGPDTVRLWSGQLVQAVRRFE